MTAPTANPIATNATIVNPADAQTASQTDQQGLKVEAGSDGAAATGHVPLDPSIPAPGTTEKRQRISDALSDPDKNTDVESVDKGA